MPGERSLEHTNSITPLPLITCYQHHCPDSKSIAESRRFNSIKNIKDWKFKIDFCSPHANPPHLIPLGHKYLVAVSNFGFSTIPLAPGVDEQRHFRGMRKAGQTGPTAQQRAQLDQPNTPAPACSYTHCISGPGSPSSYTSSHQTALHSKQQCANYTWLAHCL